MNIFWSFNLLPNEAGYKQAKRALPEGAEPKLLTESELSKIQSTKSYIHFIVQHAACGPDNLPWVKVFEDSEEGGDQNFRSVKGSELSQGKEEALVVYFMCSRKVPLKSIKSGGEEKPKVDYSWLFETFKGYHFAVIPGGSLPVSFVPKFFDIFRKDGNSRLDSIQQLVHDYSVEIKNNGDSETYFEWADHSLAKVKGLMPPPQPDLGCCCGPKVSCYGPSVEYQPNTRLGMIATLHEGEEGKTDEIFLDAEAVVAILDAHSKWEFKKSGTIEEEKLYKFVLHSVETEFGDFLPLVDQLQSAKSVRFHKQIDPDDVSLWEDGQHKAIVERILQLVATKNKTFAQIVAQKSQIFQGLYDADYINPYYNSNTFISHFYDPDEKVSYLEMKGKNMFTLQSICWQLAYQVATRAGEDLSKHAVNQFDHYVSNSLTLARIGKFSDAAYNLGISLHYLTDLSQPMHAANFIAAPYTTSNFHQAFEKAIEERLDLVRSMTYQPVSVGDDFQAIAIALATVSKRIFQEDIVKLLESDWADRRHIFKEPWADLVTPENSTPVATKALQNGLNYACHFLEVYQSKL